MIVKEKDRLKQKLLLLGGKVEENFNRAVSSVENRDVDMADLVINTDRIIDNLEVDIEEECLKILALHQPVARDLRFIVTALKVNNDLERIDDHSVHIAQHALFFANKPIFKFPFDFTAMSAITRRMLKDSLDSLVDLDQNKAMSVRAMDDDVDDMNRAMYEACEKGMREHPEQISMYIHSMGISRTFERIADLSTNIAEDVIYLISGQIVRH
ncbi:MAG: phosphate signaling complex protein PhoU [Deltaproteobacteria bacterium]|nr:phosphate signaling complex protein PhoU [Deltaproteobacteria bacterium]MBN2670212.1 phosphate signaling complex protein PhoU [Deltaproteobacteria bacterium]